MWQILAASSGGESASVLKHALCNILGNLYANFHSGRISVSFLPPPSTILTVIQRTGQSSHGGKQKLFTVQTDSEWSKSDTDPQCAAAAQGNLTSRFNHLQACLCSGAQPVRGVSSWVMWWDSSARKRPSCAVLATRRAALPPDTMLTWSYGTQRNDLKLVFWIYDRSTPPNLKPEPWSTSAAD